MSDSRNCILKHVIGRKLDGTERRGKKRKQLPNDLKEKIKYCNLREEAAKSTLRRTSFGRGYGPFARQTIYRRNLALKMLVTLKMLLTSGVLAAAPRKMFAMSSDRGNSRDEVMF